MPRTRLGSPARRFGTTRDIEPGDRRRSFANGSIRRLVVIYLLAGLGAFVLCGVGLALAQRHAALVEAVRDAKVTTALLAARVVEPALPPAPGRLDANRAFDRVVRERVLGDPVTQVWIADQDGSVVYATEAGLVGERVRLSAGELDALRTGVAAVRDDGSDPTRLGGGRAGQSLHVTVGLRAPGGQPLLLQARQPYEGVWLTSRAVWVTLLPSLILALALLYLVKAGFCRPPDPQPVRRAGGA